MRLLLKGLIDVLRRDRCRFHEHVAHQRRFGRFRACPAGFRRGRIFRTISLEIGHKRIDVKVVRLLDGFDELFHEIRGLEHRADEFRGGHDLAVSQIVEHFLEAVSDRADAVEAQKAGRAFDRVHRAEHGVHEVSIDIPPAASMASI